MYRLYKSYVPILFSLRFITLISHVVLLILLIMDRSPNVKKFIKSSSGVYKDSDFNKLDSDYTVWLSVSIGFVGTEILSNIFTVTSLAVYQSLISILTHSIGVFVLFGFYVETYSADYIRWIFGFCTAVPFLTECFSYFQIFYFKK